MDQADLDHRNLTYRLFLEMGRAPTAEEVAVAAPSNTAEVQAGWRRLHDQHASSLTRGGATDWRPAGSHTLAIRTQRSWTSSA
jgi:hypothetical protein